MSEFREERYITSESVTKGHPDKLCDQISDAILDDILGKDPFAHVACEVTASAGLIHVMGEISTSCYVDIQGVVRDTVRKIGYNSPVCGFDASSCAVITSISTQSDDIAVGVRKSFELKNKIGSELKDQIGAGDQGIMYGYACKETDTLMPMPIYLAHKVTKALSTLRETRTLDYLYPDGKAQITVKYKGEVPVEISKIVISTQHSATVLTDQIVRDLTKFIVKNPEILPQGMLNEKTEVFINPTGRFVIGGPVADTGLTGRKIMVDTYGGVAHHGGGAFSGKDGTKVDRSGAYMARYVAKNIVGANLAKKCEVSVGYAIGVARPVSLYVDSFGTSNYSNKELTDAMSKVFDFRPSAIIEKLGLRKPIYKDLAAYGHFGREDLNLPWEQLDKTEDLLNVLHI